MSEIDIERLKVDESLWPEGMTHYCPEARMFYRDNYPQGPCCIPRPTKPEWVDGLPPVGCECEALFMHGATTKWRKCEILRLSDNGRECAIYVPELNRLGWCNTFRQIKSPAERLREELADFIKHSGACWSSDIADAILNKFNVTRK